MPTTPPVRRRDGGRVSGSARAAMSSSSAPSTASAPNTPAPVGQAQQLAADGRREHRCRAEHEHQPRQHDGGGVCRSRGRARRRSRPRRPPRRPSPCSRRSPPSTATFGATMHSSDARTCTAVPTSTGRRRPTASETGPRTSWPRPRPTSVPVSVSCTGGRRGRQVVAERRQRRQVHVDGRRAERDERAEDEHHPAAARRRARPRARASRSARRRAAVVVVTGSVLSSGAYDGRQGPAGRGDSLL